MACRYIPGAIRRLDDIPQVGEKIVILSLLDIVDDGAYEIVEKDVTDSHSQKHYLRANALTYTPGHAAHLDWFEATARFSYQTLGILPVVFSILCPYYATLALETYQHLCQRGTYEPKGKGGRDALRLQP